MLGISFATVLFTLSIWKLLSFFIMPSLFFDLLFVGFPLGAFLGARFFRVSVGSFQRTLVILQVAMILSVVACLACKHFDYLRAHLFEVRLGRLLLQMGIFTGMFLPFFCSYGLSEYVGYQLGTQQLRGRMRWVYGIYLFGAATAYLFLNELLARLGVTGMVVLSISCVALPSLLLARTVSGRVILGLEVLALGALLLLPTPEREVRFLEVYKGRGMQSTWDYRQLRGFTPSFQKWGRYSLTEILRQTRAPDGQELYAGFYNDIMQWEYAPRCGFDSLSLGAVPIHFARQGARIAIIGAGGGRQVRWAQQPRYRFESIVAIELEPVVFEAVRGSLIEAFSGVYEKEGICPVIAEARGFMEITEQVYDLIFLPSVGGYPQMMLEPGNMIRTFDAYRTLRNRLGDQGVLAIWYPRGLDGKGILTNQYVRTLGRQGLGMSTRAYYNRSEYLILASKSSDVPLPSPEDIDAFLQAPADPSGLPPVLGEPTYELFVPDDPRFQPITDDQPFLAGNVRNIFSLEQVYGLFGIVCAFLLLVGAGLLAVLRRTGDPRIPGRSFGQVAGLSFLIGANFILCEHFAVLALFRKLYVFHDALVIGAISFLVLSGFGSVLITPAVRAPAQALAVLLLVPLLLVPGWLSPEAVLVLMAPLAFTTGSFFPALFERCAHNPLGVFALDAVGAAVGSACAFFLPIAFGFSVFFPVAAGVFVWTTFASWRFHRSVLSSSSELQ